MTTTPITTPHPSPPSTPTTVDPFTVDVPRRATLVVLAAAFLAFYAAMFATGSDTNPDSSLRQITSAYDYSETALRISGYAGMAGCALLVFLGGAIRAALRSRRAAWTADVAVLGFVVVALTVASWAVSGLAQWHAVAQGEEASVRTLNFIDTSNFLPLMLGMICVYVGTGIAGLTIGALPRWLALVSVGLGCLAPLGPLAFVPALVLPLWTLAVALTVRLEPVPGPAS